MKKILDFLFSTRIVGFLLISFAVSMAVGTFVEKYFGTPTAKEAVYGAKWFEFLMLWLILSFVSNIEKYKLYRKEKWSMLMFHLAFILIFLGAGITRYISYEGNMRIREGATSSEIISSDTYLKVRIDDDENVLEYLPKCNLSALHKDEAKWPFKKSYKKRLKFEDKHVDVELLDFVPNAKDSLILDDKGELILKIVSSSDIGRENTYMRSGDIKQLQNSLFSFNEERPGMIEIFYKNDKLFIRSPFPGEYLTMATQTQGTVIADSLQELIPLSLYQINQTNFVVPEMAKKARLHHYSDTSDQSLADALKFNVSSGEESKIITIKGGRGRTLYDKDISINGLHMMIGFGSKLFKTPFAVRLNDFELERYPGSNSASSYASEITIIDEGKEKDFRIFMNNVLDYKGFRLFQSSYDPDELGTILSANHDLLGTIVTYLGYGFLFLGMLLTLFWKGTRFWQINDTLKKLSKKKGLAILLFLFANILNAQHQGIPEFHPDSIVAKLHIDKDHAKNFGSLLVQDFQGRTKPINTMALEVLRKVHGRDKLDLMKIQDKFSPSPYVKSEKYTLDANQFFIALHSDLSYWLNVPFIKVGKKGGDKLKELVKANDQGYTAMTNLIDVSKPQGGYILGDIQRKAFAKDPATRTDFDKEIIKLDERFQILNGIPIGSFLRIIPIKNELNNTWTSWMTQDQKIDSVASSYFKKYFTAVNKGLEKNDWQEANTAVTSIDEYQQKWGSNIIPPKRKVALELFYNNSNIFFRLMILYTLLGMILLVLSFALMFKESKGLKYIANTFIFLAIGAFLAHIAGLSLRWYISGHAPWSSGYEAVIFISSISVLAGILLYRNRNTFILTAGCLVAVIMMGFAHGGSLLDPQITPLVPVLKSYWLLIHVAIITSSYGFFGLGFVLSIFTLLLFILKKFSTNKKIETSIKELSIVNEMTLSVGIFALTIGTFLGGMWANESWGRYWSWDPKETWAFISVIVYAFVLHMRLIPGLRGRLPFSIGSLWAFSSIVFTYIGVNYFLSGLHSYATGDPIQIPSWVYISVASLLALCVLAWWSNRDKELS